MKLKDDEVAQLATNLKEELSKRDKIISDLIDKIDGISSSNSITSTDENEELGSQQEAEPELKIEHDLLIIGDSLVRNVSGEAINPGVTLLLSVYPVRDQKTSLRLSVSC